MIAIPKQKKSGIPLLGLGTWKLYGDECEKTVRDAIEMGYRHIDTADVYQNHAEIGRAIKPYPRDQLYLVSKVFEQDLVPNKIKTAVPRFLDELGVEYLDLLLIHWPFKEMDLADCLSTMQELSKQGLVRSIGISNFVRSHLKTLDPYHFPIVTNQIELHPYLQRRELVEACKERGITITAYRPLAKGAFEDDPVLKKIGKKYNKSPSQVVLRWLIQQDIVAIPKASNPKHMKDNLDIFDFSLSDEEMQVINQLDCGKRYCSPDNVDDYED